MGGEEKMKENKTDKLLPVVHVAFAICVTVTAFTVGVVVLFVVPYGLREFSVAAY
jgi:hypothetical protein